VSEQDAIAQHYPAFFYVLTFLDHETDVPMVLTLVSRECPVCPMKITLHSQGMLYMPTVLKARYSFLG
jgi:hypothetical protein